MTDSFDLAGFTAVYVSCYLLAAVRVLAAISLNPLFGSNRVPLSARVGLGLFVTLAVVPPVGPETREVSVGPLEIGGELLVGLLAGFTVVLVFNAIQFAAHLVGVNAGFGFGGTVDPAFDLGSGGLDRFFASFALLVFVQTNGHHVFLTGLRELFDVIDVGAVTLEPGTPERLAVLSAGVFSSALKMALPALAALLLADLGLALLARVAPQFNLFAIGMPVKMAVGLGALLVALPVMVPQMAALFRGLPAVMTVAGQ